MKAGSVGSQLILYFNDSSGVRGIEIDAATGRFFLFTGSSEFLQRMLDGLSLSKWTAMKSRFKTRPGRIVDSFQAQSSYDVMPIARLGNLNIWGSASVSGSSTGLGQF
ncbi:MAG: hypothetical protein M3N13_04580 [Candidatus Eremiobacteraeota bacterium]|nr:hypothetical protein [Candidatus Eremiobacteraeota bacterium]